jgi:hypothetical protein
MDLSVSKDQAIWKKSLLRGYFVAVIDFMISFLGIKPS